MTFSNPRRLARAACVIAFAVATPTVLAADLTLLCAGAMKPTVTALLAKRDPALPKVDVTVATAGGIRERIARGERYDAVIAPSDVTADLIAQKLLDAKSLRPLGETEIGIAVKTGAPVPDVTTPEALRATLLAAQKVVIVDPTKGTSGRLLEAMFKDMGIADQMNAKLIKIDGGMVTEAVARGEADLGFQQASEILPVVGVQLIGTLPGRLKTLTRYDLALMPDRQSRADAEALSRSFATQDAYAVIEKSGFTPVR